MFYVLNIITKRIEKDRERDMKALTFFTIIRFKGGIILGKHKIFYGRSQLFKSLHRFRIKIDLGRTKIKSKFFSIDLSTASGTPIRPKSTAKEKKKCRTRFPWDTY